MITDAILTTFYYVFWYSHSGALGQLISFGIFNLVHTGTSGALGQLSHIISGALGQHWSIDAVHPCFNGRTFEFILEPSGS